MAARSGHREAAPSLVRKLHRTSEGDAASRLALRVNPLNLDHHIWNNNGTWWCHYTLHLPDYTKQRRRVSLRTADHEVARSRRDVLLARGRLQGP